MAHEHDTAPIAQAEGHTRGPWAAETKPGYEPPADWQGRVTAISEADGATLIVADDLHHGADARLMASAPDLLAALRECRDALESNIVNDLDAPILDNPAAPALKRASLAITKATP